MSTACPRRIVPKTRMAVGPDCLRLTPRDAIFIRRGRWCGRPPSVIALFFCAVVACPGRLGLRSLGATAIRLGALGLCAGSGAPFAVAVRYLREA